MRMPALALFERALRLETRSLVICLARVGLLLIIFLILLPLQSMSSRGWYGAPGLTFLEQMVWTNLIFISVAGLSYFSSAITEEKEEMTLGLLRMTGLNPIAILLGKSTSRLVGAVLLLSVQIPFILLAVTLGGVGLPQIAAAYSTLLAYMFFICNFALLFSVIFRNTATAGAAALVLLVLFFFGSYWALDLERSFASDNGTNLTNGIWPTFNAVLELWRQASPIEKLIVVFRTGFTGPVISFQIVSNLVLGVFFFLMAWLVFDWCTREEKDAAPTRRWFSGSKSRRSRIPPQLVGPAAITWKDYTFIGGGKFGILLKFGVIALMIGVCHFIAYENDQPFTRKFEGPVLIWTSVIGTAIWLALEASRIFREEVRWKTLSSLVTLPISVGELAYRKVAGALLGTLPLLGGAVLGIILVPDEFADFLNAMFGRTSEFGMFLAFICQFILFLHLIAFLSLVIKWGALPLAFVIQYIGGSFFMGVIMAMSAMTGFQGMTFFVAFGCLVASAFLHRGIAYRLERAAAEE